MQIDFAPSERSTIGIEWELAIVDPTTGSLRSDAQQVLEALRQGDGSEHPKITGELLLNTVELVTGVHHTVAQAVLDLTTQLAEVHAVTDRLGLEVMCSGSHPFGRWFDQKISDKERYHRLIERTQWWGRNMMIWGIHVHVGIESHDKVLPLMNGLLRYLPHFQALSASSPFWAGVNTGYASHRALMFQQLPSAGLPDQLADWQSYQSYIADLQATDIVVDHSEVRWDIRPSPQWGTLEIRSCDGVASVEEIGGISAFIQCIVEQLSSQLDAAEKLPTLPPWFVRENKWRSARYGLDATIILDAAGNQRAIKEDIRDLLVQLKPVAQKLGCEKELNQVHLILEHGASYQRQLLVEKTHSGNLGAVVSALVNELRHGLVPR